MQPTSVSVNESLILVSGPNKIAFYEAALMNPFVSSQTDLNQLLNLKVSANCSRIIMSGDHAMCFVNLRRQGLVLIKIKRFMVSHKRVFETLFQSKKITQCF